MSSDYITRIKTFDGEKQIDYNSLANLPDIPQGTSELINDAGFLTHIPSPTNTTLGGIKAQPRGHEDNAEVKVGADTIIFCYSLVFIICNIYTNLGLHRLLYISR